jgi:hypothetical protein
MKLLGHSRGNASSYHFFGKAAIFVPNKKIQFVEKYLFKKFLKNKHLEEISRRVNSID